MSVLGLSARVNITNAEGANDSLVIKGEAVEKVAVDGKEKDQITKTTIWYVKGKGIVKQFIELAEANRCEQ